MIRYQINYFLLLPLLSFFISLACAEQTKKNPSSQPRSAEASEKKQKTNTEKRSDKEKIDAKSLDYFEKLIDPEKVKKQESQKPTSTNLSSSQATVPPQSKSQESMATMVHFSMQFLVKICINNDRNAFVPLAQKLVMNKTKPLSDLANNPEYGNFDLPDLESFLMISPGLNNTQLENFYKVICNDFKGESLKYDFNELNMAIGT